MAQHEGIEIDALFRVVNDAAKAAKDQVAEIKSKKNDEISIGQMFEMQILMNNLSQLCEMSSSVVGAMNQSLNSIARAIKQ